MVRNQNSSEMEADGDQGWDLEWKLLLHGRGQGDLGIPY